MYVGLFLLAPFLNILYHALPDKRAKQGLLLVMVLLTGVPGLLDGMGWKNLFMPAWWTGMYPLTYYFLGVYIREHQPKLKKSLGVGLILGMIALEAAITMWAAGGGKFVAVFGYYDSAAVMLLAVVLFVVCYDLEIKSPRLNRACERLSRFSLDIYLCSYITDTFFYPRLSAVYAGGWPGLAAAMQKPLEAPFAVPQADIFPYILVIVPLSLLVCLAAGRMREGMGRLCRVALDLPRRQK